MPELYSYEGPHGMARLIAACKYLNLTPPPPNSTTLPDLGDVLIAIAEKLQQLEANRD